MVSIAFMRLCIVDIDSRLDAMTANDMFIIEERYNSLIYVVTRQQVAMMCIVGLLWTISWTNSTL